MRLVIFDVWNAACALVISPTWYSIMVDCGSNSEKPCPVDFINQNKEKLWMKKFHEYDLTLLHITHPDNDHIRNSKKILDSLPPYLLNRTPLSKFPINEEFDDNYKILDAKYNSYNFDTPDRWWITETYSIEMDILQSNENLSSSIRNNSSVILLIECCWRRILFWWDMEAEWWNRLCDNKPEFVESMKKWIDVFITPHHGHNSAFPSKLFENTWNIWVIIHSKWSEWNIDWTNVSSEYSKVSNWVIYTNLNDNRFYKWNVLTTRSNWRIEIDFYDNYQWYIYTEKASPNHDLYTFQ